MSKLAIALCVTYNTPFVHKTLQPIYIYLVCALDSVRCVSYQLVSEEEFFLRYMTWYDTGKIIMDF